MELKIVASPNFNSSDGALHGIYESIF